MRETPVDNGTLRTSLGYMYTYDTLHIALKKGNAPHDALRGLPTGRLFATCMAMSDFCVGETRADI